LKTIRLEFGRFIFLDNHAVVAEAKEGVNIDSKKVQRAIDIIEKELPGNYGLILDRKADYSIMPVEVYKYFASRKRLKALAIVKYADSEFLPDNMEQKIFKGNIEKFSSINAAHAWINNCIVTS
jgi:hypothetical protein